MSFYEVLLILFSETLEYKMSVSLQHGIQKSVDYNIITQF